MREGQLSTWLYKNGAFMGKGDKRSYTHLCLDGGRLCVSQEIHDEFIRRYSSGIEKDERYYICEVPTSVCRMYCDLDFIEENIYSLDKIKIVVKIIHKIIEKYYDESFNIIVCTTDPKFVTRDKQKMIKTGVHLIWENLYVSRVNALNLSRQFVDVIVEELGERPDYNKWDDVIDDCVYSEASPSLRMVGSAKISKKKKTNKENETEIVMVDEGRIYNPCWCYNGNSEVSSFVNKSDRFVAPGIH